MLTLSIIIVNYNTSQMSAECIDSLRKYTSCDDYEIIVVDNASCEQEVQRLRQITNVQLLLLSQNVGFGRANNVGIKIAQGRFVLLLNPDTLFIHDAIAVLLDYMALHPNVGACGASLLNMLHQKIHAYSRRFPSPWVEFDTFLRHWPSRLIGMQTAEMNQTRLPLDVAYITGADLMLRRRALEQVGVFDVDFFMYYEETELCARLQRRGWRIVYVPTAEIVHLEGKSQGDNLLRYRRVLEGRRVYMKKMGYRTYGNMLYLGCMLLAVLGFAMTVKFVKLRQMSRKIPVFVAVNFRQK